MKIFVIADPETYLVFTLAGIRGKAVKSETEVPAILASLAREEVGLVLITEPIAERNREVIERILIEPGGPLILEIPATKGPVQTRTRTTERLVSLLRR